MILVKQKNVSASFLMIKYNGASKSLIPYIYLIAGLSLPQIYKILMKISQ
ncbi:unnamed protein product [Paramecium octaurelia]|uniref:Uncharacterized protein n=1 Tax=Paramecium octaurelia TaxID=43137 RepID=A0A8S1WKU1_PAROT|nr:unnamed protein product [Paramecium octaurelia]